MSYANGNAEFRMQNADTAICLLAHVALRFFVLTDNRSQDSNDLIGLVLQVSNLVVGA